MESLEYTELQLPGSKGRLALGAVGPSHVSMPHARNQGPAEMVVHLSP